MLTNRVGVLSPLTLLQYSTTTIRLSNQISLTTFGYTISTSLHTINESSAPVTLTLSDPVSGNTIGTYTVGLGETYMPIPVSDLIGLHYIQIATDVLKSVRASIVIDSTEVASSSLGNPSNETNIYSGLPVR